MSDVRSGTENLGERELSVVSGRLLLRTNISSYQNSGKLSDITCILNFQHNGVDLEIEEHKSLKRVCAIFDKWYCRIYDFITELQRDIGDTLVARRYFPTSYLRPNLARDMTWANDKLLLSYELWRPQTRPSEPSTTTVQRIQPQAQISMLPMGFNQSKSPFSLFCIRLQPIGLRSKQLTIQLWLWRHSCDSLLDTRIWPIHARHHELREDIETIG